MKRSSLLFALFVPIFTAFSQEECEDMIYTIKENRILFNCCIEEVVNGNMVIFLKDGERDSVAAYAVNKGGQFLELVRQGEPLAEKPLESAYDPNLYKGYTYAYYEDLLRRSKNIQGFGLTITVVGLGLGIAGTVGLMDNFGHWNDEGLQAKLLLAGVILFNVGMPVMISGSVMRSNNKKALGIIQTQKGLSLGITNYGVSLTYRF